jgi:hypothetical protein
MFNTYDHNLQNARDPVRSPIDKLASAGLVVGSVTTSESPVLYVSFCLLFLFLYVVNLLHYSLLSNSQKPVQEKWGSCSVKSLALFWRGCVWGTETLLVSAPVVGHRRYRPLSE